MGGFEGEFGNPVPGQWLVVDLSWAGSVGRYRDTCVCGRSIWQMGVPAHSQEWLQGAHVLGEDPVQLRLAESKRPTRQAKGGSWKVGLELQGQAPSEGGDLGLGLYLES